VDALTRDEVRRWLEDYVQAWHSYDPEQIGDLFSEGAEYRYHPWDDPPLSGREAIVANWLENRDAAGTYEGRYDAFAVEGDRAVAVGISRYWTDEGHSKLDRVYHNVFLLRFDSEGRCSSFTEVFLKEPDPPSAVD
jgi:hypothetical protein